MTKTTALVVLLVATGATWAQDYCKICPDHTMCLFSGNAPRCARLLSAGLSARDKAQVLDVHNRLRSKVAAGNETASKHGPLPPAANMRSLEWDDELAMVAQRWADQCSTSHDQCRDVPRFDVSQNTYLFSSNLRKDLSTNWRKAVLFWYADVKNFDIQDLSPFEYNVRAGHYSQLAWAATHRLGCGFALFQEPRWYRYLYVCNYGPAGNIISWPMYQVGAACSQCPHQAPLCEDSLCTA